MHLFENSLMFDQIEKRLKRLRPLEQHLLTYFIQQHEMTNFNQPWVEISFTDFKALLGFAIPDKLAHDYLVKSLETLLFTRGYYHAKDHASIEYQLIAGYKINPDHSSRIYFNTLILPLLKQQLLLPKYMGTNN